MLNYALSTVVDFGKRIAWGWGETLQNVFLWGSNFTAPPNEIIFQLGTP